MNTFSFTNHDDTGLTTTVSFTFEADSIHIGSFAELCNRAAKCFGWCEKSVEEYIPTDEDGHLLDDLGVGVNEDED